MERVVVAVFDQRQDAQLAREALTDVGFRNDNIRITSQDSGEADQSVSSLPAAEDRTLGEKIASFFGFGEDDDTYNEAVRRGSCVLTVEAADEEEADRAQAVLYRFELVDIDERTAAWRASGWEPAAASRSAIGAGEAGGAAAAGQAGQAGGAAGAGGESTIPVTEEQMEVGKREVQKGGVRVVSRTVERPVQADVSLREEHATVTREPVDRPATDADKPFEPQSVEVRETAEEPVIGKTKRVVEEVHVGKEADIREQTIQDNVRKTEVDVQQVGAEESRGTGSDQPRQSAYTGPERRRPGTTPYSGVERRAAA
jgi:uncharacterized protein (TIGR02271 family)